MGERIGIEVSIAVSEAVKLCNTDVIAAYPITPQTHIVEHLSEIVADGDLDAEFIPVESEHSAASVCCGSSATGARTYTATASQGLALMHEILFCISALRLPIHMTVVNRALSAPLSIWNDHSDVMASRDCGWIQVFVENGQEAFDHTICSFRIAEDHRVLLPTIVNLDGFNMSHVIEPLEMVDQELVNKFLPVYKPLYSIHPDKPLTMGAFGMPEIYVEAKKAHDEALRSAQPVIEEVWAEWAELTGRRYRPVETYRLEGAEIVLLTMGGIGETAMVAVDQMREQGIPVGLVKLRLWRPLPMEILRETLKGAADLIICDRAISPGSPGGPVAAEISQLLIGGESRPRIHDYLVGIGGRDVPPETFEGIVSDVQADVAAGKARDFHFYGVRE